MGSLNLFHRSIDCCRRSSTAVVICWLAGWLVGWPQVYRQGTIVTQCNFGSRFSHLCTFGPFPFLPLHCPDHIAFERTETRPGHSVLTADSFGFCPAGRVMLMMMMKAARRLWWNLHGISRAQDYGGQMGLQEKMVSISGWLWWLRVNLSAQNIQAKWGINHRPTISCIDPSRRDG